MSKLIQSSLQPSSIPTYRRAWKLYRQFADTVFHSAAVHLPNLSSDLGLFIAYLFQCNYAASTANTYVSALGYSHRLIGVPDPTKVFWLKEMLKGYGKLGTRLDTRMPITLPILRSILRETPTICGSDYRRFLFTAMCTTAFFGFLRVGEITCCAQSPDVLQLTQVVCQLEHLGNLAGFKVTFTHFKHSYNQRAVSIALQRRSDVCPVQNLHAYLLRRGFSNGPLFRTEHGHAVPQYKGNSFRIGAVTLAAESGFSDAQIRLLGRWKSDAFRKYIRSPGLHAGIAHK